MTIAQAINDIAAAQGGTPARPATIAGAIDALNDALAGSDQQAARTIEDAVVLLGEHIGGGGSGGGGEGGGGEGGGGEGGGADIGELYELSFIFTMPTVGNGWGSSMIAPVSVSALGVGSSPLFDLPPTESWLDLDKVAEGATLKTMWLSDSDPVEYGGVYTVTVITGRSEKVGAVVDLNVTATTETMQSEDATYTRFSFTVPPAPVAADVTLGEDESIYAVINCVCLLESDGR